MTCLSFVDLDWSSHWSVPHVCSQNVRNGEFWWPESLRHWPCNHNTTAQIHPLLSVPIQPSSLSLSVHFLSALHCLQMAPNATKYRRIPNTCAECHTDNLEETESGGWRQSFCGLSHYLSRYHSGNQEQKRARGNGSNDRQSPKPGVDCREFGLIVFFMV